MELFEQALRNKDRFETARGVLTIEDLFDLPVESTNNRLDLSTIHGGLIVLKNLSSGQGLLKKKSGIDETLERKISIIEHIAAVKMAEQEAKEKEAETKSKKAKLLGFLEERQNESLRSLPEDELKKLIDSL